MGDNGWQRKFEDPIPLPNGKKLVTLRDAADYITSLPKKESDLPEWQTAIEVQMLVSRSGPTMMARIGVMRALNRHVEGCSISSAKIPIGETEAEAGSVISPLVTGLDAVRRTLLPKN